MPSALVFLLAGASFVAVLSLGAWMIGRPTRSPLKSVQEFQESMRALSSRRSRRG